MAPCIILMLPIYTMYVQEELFSKKALLSITLGIITGLVALGFLFRTTVVSMSYFMNYRYAIIIMIIIYMLAEFKILRLPQIKIEFKNQKLNFMFGIATAIAWIPCISIFFFPVTIASIRYEVYTSAFLYIIYALGVITPILIITKFESILLQRIKVFSIKHQNKIKLVTFSIFIIFVFISFFVFNTQCVDCIKPI